MKIFNLQQKSPEWLAWRATGLGSSDAPVLVHGKHYKTTRQDLLAIKAGHDDLAALRDALETRGRRVALPRLRAVVKAGVREAADGDAVTVSI